MCEDKPSNGHPPILVLTCCLHIERKKLLYCLFRILSTWTKLYTLTYRSKELQPFIWMKVRELLWQLLTDPLVPLTELITSNNFTIWMTNFLQLMCWELACLILILLVVMASRFQSVCWFLVAFLHAFIDCKCHVVKSHQWTALII